MSGDLLPELNRQGWLTTLQVAELFGVPRGYVSELVKHRKGRKGKPGRPPLLETHRVGHLLLVRREAALRYQAMHPRLGNIIARRIREGRRAAS